MILKAFGRRGGERGFVPHSRGRPQELKGLLLMSRNRIRIRALSSASFWVNSFCTRGISLAGKRGEERVGRVEAVAGVDRRF